MPRLREKNDCPNAPNTPVPVSLLKSGSKRNCNPSFAPGNVKERTTISNSRIKSTGIRILEIFSMPFCTPKEITSAVRARNANWKSTGQKECEVKEAKASATSLGVSPDRRLVHAMTI